MRKTVKFAILIKLLTLLKVIKCRLLAHFCKERANGSVEFCKDDITVRMLSKANLVVFHPTKLTPRPF